MHLRYHEQVKAFLHFFLIERSVNSAEWRSYFYELILKNKIYPDWSENTHTRLINIEVIN